MILGAHISKDKTLTKTIQNIKNFNGNALQFFSKNPRSNEPVNIEKYNDEIQNKISKNFHLVIHSSYTINIASPLSSGKRQMDINDMYWFSNIISDLELAHKLDIIGSIIHVGKYTKQTKEEGLNNMRNAMENIIKKIKREKWKSKIILETAAGQGTELLVDIDELIKFYNDINEPNYFKLCFDTCHVWSAGYDLVDSYEKIQKETDNAIEVIHLNGSKTPKNSRKDRHSCIQDKDSSIPMIEIINFVKYVKKVDKHVIIILETPSDYLKEEIDFLRNI
jgi:deoxyribonuclease-4